MSDPNRKLAAARDDLRAYHEQQQAALANYFALEKRADKLRVNLSAVETEQRAALAELTRSTDAGTAARLTGASVKHARESLAHLPGPAGPGVVMSPGTDR
ncbi:MAG: hypothetical protein ABI862_18820 [Ilumatobacteraceae bacterium]